MSGAAETWTVVLADDAEDLRFLIGRMLERDGRFRVVGQAGDGRAAIEVVDRERPHLLLLDLSMPVMDGLEALPIVRDRCPDTVVVVLSGFDAGQMQERARVLGAAGYVEKGAAFAALGDTLATHLS